jgi:hypothetical protein
MVFECKVKRICGRHVFDKVPLEDALRSHRSMSSPDYEKIPNLGLELNEVTLPLRA